MTGWVECDAINKTNCESLRIDLCLCVYEIDWQWLLLLHSIPTRSHRQCDFFAMQRVNVWLWLRLCVCVYVTTPKSRFSWRMEERRVEFPPHVCAYAFGWYIIKAVDLEFKLLNNNNTCSHLAFIVLLFSFRHFVHCFCDPPLLLLLHHHNKSLLAVWGLMFHRFIWFHFLSLLLPIRAIFFIDLDLMGYHTVKPSENIKF